VSHQTRMSKAILSQNCRIIAGDEVHAIRI